MNSKPRINTNGHALDNPDRWAVYYEDAESGLGAGWHVAQGMDVKENFETFAEAIEYAQKQARQ